MTEQALQQLHNEIFDFLFDKYLEARARGEEFYFLVRKPSISAFDYLHGDISEENLFRLQRWFYSPIDEMLDVNDTITYSFSDNEILISFWISNAYTNRIKSFANFIVSPKQSQVTVRIGFQGAIISNMSPSSGDLLTDQAAREKRTQKTILLFQEIAKKVGAIQISTKEGLHIFSQWEKKYNHFPYYLDNLNDAIEENKPLIDVLIQELGEKKEEYPHFGNIPPKPFLADTAKIKELRNLQTFVKEKHENIAYRFHYLKVKNFKAIQKLEIRSVPTSAHWIFFTGENGYGKTLILQAIAVGLYGKNNEEGQILIDEKNYIELNYTNTWGQFHSTFSDNFEKGGGISLVNAIRRTSLLAYSANRTFSSDNARGTILHLFAEDIGLPFLAKEWYSIGLNDTELAQEQFRILKEKLSKLGLILELDKVQRCLIFTQTTFEGETFEKVRFEELSAAYKNIFLLVADIILKFTTYNPKATNIALDDLSGIVIIDEFELHLHPKMQRFLVEKLTELFPKVQFIVSTHSPIPLLGAPENSVIFHVDRDKERGIFVERLDNAVGKSMDFIMANVFETPEKYGGETQRELDTFYKMRDKILAQEPVNEQVFLTTARKLALRDIQIQTKVQFELQQLRKVTGKEGLKI